MPPLNRLFTGFHAAAVKARHGNWDDFESALHEFCMLASTCYSSLLSKNCLSFAPTERHLLQVGLTQQEFAL